MRLTRKARAKIAAQSIHWLAKFADKNKCRLHPEAIRAEVRYRVNEHHAKNATIKRHAAKRASRVLK